MLMVSQLLSPSQQHAEHKPTPLSAGVFPPLPHKFAVTPLQVVKKWKCILCRMMPALREPWVPFISNVFSSTLELTPKDHSSTPEFSTTRALRHGYLLLLPSCPLLAQSFLFCKWPIWMQHRQGQDGLILLPEWFLFFFSASLSYFKIISPSIPILPFHKHCFSSFSFCI